MRKFNQDRGFGIEIELACSKSKEVIAQLISDAGVVCESESYNHMTVSYWKIVKDVSINPSSGARYTMEIVSPILYGTAGLAELNKVLNVLNNTDGVTTKVNKSMGIHVHHDLTNWRNGTRENFANNMNNLVSLVSKYEHCLFSLLPPSRQSQWCRPVREFMIDYRTNDVCSYTNRVRTLKRIHRNEDLGSFQENPTSGRSGMRYCGLNFANLFTRGSVEFRYHQASTNIQKLSAWIVFTQAFVETAELKKSISYTDAMTRTTVASALRRLRCDLGLTKANNDFYLQGCDAEIKRRYHLYKTNAVTNSFVAVAR